MDEKFKRVKTSDLGFIGTSTCGATEHLNKWEEGSGTAWLTPRFDKSGQRKRSIQLEQQYFFTSRGPLPELDKKRLDLLSLDQGMQQLGLLTSVSPSEEESFDWYKVGFAWAVTYKDKAYVAKTISKSSGGIGSSCGGAGIGNCASAGMGGADGGLAIVGMMN
ncbi:hypothetical protein MBANPS3_002232 [Mucor bainieri]